jgi:hypothetical protein
VKHVRPRRLFALKAAQGAQLITLDWMHARRPALTAADMRRDARSGSTCERRESECRAGFPPGGARGRGEPLPEIDLAKILTFVRKYRGVGMEGSSDGHTPILLLAIQ